MKYCREFYLLLAHTNPALYDVIFPVEASQFNRDAPRELASGNDQTQASTLGTDSDGELKEPSKLSWKMKNLGEDLRTIVIQAKTSPHQGDRSKRNDYVLELIGDYCATKTKFPFPPKPHWVDGKVTVEEKIAAAAVFAQAATSLEGTELERILLEGADKILDSAMAEFTDVRDKPQYHTYASTTNSAATHC